MTCEGARENGNKTALHANMGNAGSSTVHMRERHKSTDLSTPSSPANFRDSVAAGGGAGGGGGGGGAAAALGGAGAGGQAFSFDKKHTAVLNEGSLQEDDDPYYAGTGTGAGTRRTADSVEATAGEHLIMDSTEEEQVAAAAGSGNLSIIGSGDDDEPKKTALPTVLRWDGGGKNVTISGTFSNWKPISMVRSHGNFVTIIDLPEGDHQYKFCVDGEWKHDPKLVSWVENQYNLAYIFTIWAPEWRSYWFSRPLCNRRKQNEVTPVISSGFQLGSAMLIWLGLVSV